MEHPNGGKLRKGKSGLSRKPCKQHCVDVPGNGMNRKQPVFVPRFVAHLRDMKVTEIENGMESHEIISGSQQDQSLRAESKSRKTLVRFHEALVHSSGVRTGRQYFRLSGARKDKGRKVPS